MPRDRVGPRYDLWVLLVLIVTFGGFWILEDATHHRDSNDTRECPILRTHESRECFGMAAAWTFGEEGHDQRVQPKMCFVPNRDAYDTSSSVYLYVWPVAWLYLELVVSTLATMMFSWFAYRRLVAGTSESIAVRLHIIVVNFRNIFMQLMWIFVIGVLDGLTYAHHDDNYITLWPNVLVFCIFAR